MLRRSVWVNVVARRRGRKTYQVCFFDTAEKRRRVEKSFHAEALLDEFAFKFKRYLNKLGPYPLLEAEEAAKREAIGDSGKPGVPASPKKDWQENADRWIRISSGTQNTFNEKTYKLRGFQKRTHVHFVEDVTEDLASEVWAKQRSTVSFWITS